MFDTAVFVVQKLLGGSQLLFFGHHVNSWFFSNRFPDGDFRTIPLVQKLGTQVRSMYSCFAHEFSTTVAGLLVVHNSTRQPVFTRLPIYVEKVSFSDFTEVFCLLARNADWHASVCFLHAKTFLKQGLRMLKIKNELLSYVVGDCQSRRHTALVRKQFYLMATNSCFPSPS